MTGKKNSRDILLSVPYQPLPQDVKLASHLETEPHSSPHPKTKGQKGHQSIPKRVSRAAHNMSNKITSGVEQTVEGGLKMFDGVARRVNHVVDDVTTGITEGIRGDATRPAGVSSSNEHVHAKIKGQLFGADFHMHVHSQEGVYFKLGGNDKKSSSGSSYFFSFIQWLTKKISGYIALIEEALSGRFSAKPK